MYKYDATYREAITLRDGTCAVLRLIRADDGDLLLDGFARLSAESRYRRFLGVKEALSSDEVRYFTAVDGEQHLAIIAVATDARGREHHGLGVARFICMPDMPGTADVALTVIDQAQHKGLGSQLLHRLIEAARERGVQRLHFDMLATNEAMRALLHELAPDLQPRIEAGMASAEISLQDEDAPRDSKDPLGQRNSS